MLVKKGKTSISYPYVIEGGGGKVKYVFGPPLCPTTLEKLTDHFFEKSFWGPFFNINGF